jgi:hypothetical protein
MAASDGWALTSNMVARAYPLHRTKTWFLGGVKVRFRLWDRQFWTPVPYRCSRRTLLTTTACIPYNYLQKMIL